MDATPPYPDDQPTDGPPATEGRPQEPVAGAGTRSGQDFPTSPAGAPSAAAAAEPLFGRDAAARPGQVPWGARPTTVAMAVAAAPMIVITLAVALLGGAEATVESASLTFAVSTLLATLVTDTWVVGVGWWFSLWRSRLSLASWGLREARRAWTWLVPAGLGAVYLANVVYSVIARPPEQEVLTFFPRSPAGIVLMTLLAVVVAPVYEEAFFRGFVFQGLSRSWGPVWGGIVSAAAFSLVHQQLSIFVPVFLLGLVLAWVFYRTGSLYTPIALHALFNGASVLLWAFT